MAIKCVGYPELKFNAQTGYANIVNYKKYYDYSFYRSDIISKNLLFELEKYGMLLWLGMDGDIYYSLNGIKHIIPMQKIERLLSGILGRDIYVVSTHKEHEKLVKQLKERNIQNSLGTHGTEIQLSVLHIYELPVIQNTIFKPFNSRKMTYESIVGFDGKPKYINLATYNTFEPTKYLNGTNAQFQIIESQIIKYFMLLSDNVANGTEYIIHWLASFVQAIRNSDLTKIHQNSLVLIGNRTHQMNFIRLLRYIFNYILVIDDNFLTRLNTAKKQYVPFFNYHFLIFDRLSPVVMSDDDRQKIISDAMMHPLVMKIFMLETDEICYNILGNYYAIKLDDSSADDVFFEDKELENFSAILANLEIKNYLLNYSSSVELKQKYTKTLNDKVGIFIDIIINRKIDALNAVKEENFELYDEVKNDFLQGIIKQKNLIKLFDILYKNTEIYKNPKGLMRKIRHTNNDFFSAKNILQKSSVGKYFRYPID